MDDRAAIDSRYNFGPLFDEIVIKCGKNCSYDLELVQPSAVASLMQ